MGYATNITGEITIHPPIPWKYVRESLFLEANASSGDRLSWKDVVFRVAEHDVETDDGTLTNKRAVAVRAKHEGYSGHEGKLVEHLQELVDAFPEHGFRGRIDGFGEDRDDPDLWRVKVVNRKVTKFEPVLIWNEESE